MSVVDCFEEEDSNSRELLFLVEYVYMFFMIFLKYVILDSILVMSMKIRYFSSYSKGILVNWNF